MYKNYLLKKICCVCFLKLYVKLLFDASNKYVGGEVGVAVGAATHFQARPSLIVLTRRTDKERRGDKSILHNVPIVSPRRDAAVSCYSHG